jgi:molecular chaperone GrpE
MVEQNDNHDDDAPAEGPRPQPANDQGAESAGEDPRLAEAERQVAELKDRLLRALAEVENVRRRAEREAEDARKYAVSDFARELLGVADNLQRALDGVKPESREGNPALAAVLEGVELTERELVKALEKHGVRAVEALGKKLDPNLHQAVAQIDHPDAAVGEVVQVFQSGYTIADRLLRPAMVAVAKGRPAQEGSGERLDTRA